MKTCWMLLLLAPELLRSAATVVRLMPTKLRRRPLHRRDKPFFLRSLHKVHHGSCNHSCTGLVPGVLCRSPKTQFSSCISGFLDEASSSGLWSHLHLPCRVFSLATGVEPG